MTRKQALQKALETLEVLNDKEVIKKIEEILRNLPLTGWSEETIFDTIDQFVLDNNRNPTLTDFIPKGMPPHTVIKLRFGMNLKEFLEKHYPQPEIFFPSKKYGYKPIDDWKTLFITEYKRIKPTSACEYNSKRNKDIPTWMTVSKMYNISKWLEWLIFCELEKYSPTLKKRKRNVELTVLSHIDI